MRLFRRRSRAISHCWGTKEYFAIDDECRYYTLYFDSRMRQLLRFRSRLFHISRPCRRLRKLQNAMGAIEAQRAEIPRHLLFFAAISILPYAVKDMNI